MMLSFFLLSIPVGTASLGEKTWGILSDSKCLENIFILTRRVFFPFEIQGFSVGLPATFCRRFREI